MGGRRRLVLCEICLGVLLASLAIVCSSAIARFSPVRLSGFGPLVAAASVTGPIFTAFTDQLLALVTAALVTCLVSSVTYALVLLLLFYVAGYSPLLDVLSLQVLQRLVMNATAICVTAIFSVSVSHVIWPQPRWPD